MNHQQSLLNVMNHQQSLLNVLSDPSFVPPDGLLDLNLGGSLGNLLMSCSKEIQIGFAVSEARLGLPIFEAVYPSDGRPRRAVLISEESLKANFVVGNMWGSGWADNVIEARTASDTALGDANNAAATAANAADDAVHAAATYNTAVVAVRDVRDAASDAADAAYNASDAAEAARNAAYAVYYAIYAVVYNHHAISYLAEYVSEVIYYARMADPRITYEDQLRRLFMIMREHSGLSASSS